MGPLEGVTVIEIQSIGPGPFCAMMLADMGATVIRVDRASAVQPNADTPAPLDIMARSRSSIALDLKHAEGPQVLLDLVANADVLIEGFRPGVAERLGIGPEDCAAVNARLVYGRMTGWGQDGPAAQTAGHDINYIARTGALHAMGQAGERPMVPLNLVGDFGGGGMLLAFGVVCAVLEAKGSGVGQVVDAAMVDGASTLMAMFHGLAALGFWEEKRGSNLLDGGAHFYDTYETSDGKYLSLGAIEPQFYSVLIERLGLADRELPRQMAREKWPEMRAVFAEVILTKSRDEWVEIFAGSDACVAPVLTLTEAASDPHMQARQTLIEIDGVRQPAPAPRFSRSGTRTPTPAPPPGRQTSEVLSEAGFDAARISRLRDEGVIA